MNDKIRNLENVLEIYKIEIPIIQRDYAQGRNNPETKTIRSKFLDSIFESLNNNKSKLHLDFVYGSIKKSEEEKAKFIPLDGQQRLTTLFLLYWYFGEKGNKTKKELEFLEDFTYETRASSREFCRNLVKNNITISKKSLDKYIEECERKENNITISKKSLDKYIEECKRKVLSRYIKDQPWFLSYWENDPTIKSMLNMLDSIHLKTKEYENTKNFFKNLEKITFEFFPLKDFGLDDDLYIKMNARGKQLTDFEKFKAEFTKLLGKDEYKESKYVGKDENKTYKEYFSQEVDNEWTNFFWSYRDKNKEDYLIDDAFMKYINYITEMLYYKNKDKDRFSEDEKLKIEKEIKDFSKIQYLSTIIDIYKSDEENIKFLFESLNNLPKINGKFEEIFSNEYKKGKVCLFHDSIFLLEKLIKDNDDKKDNLTFNNKIILFLIIKYLDNLNLDNLKDLVRVARNLLERIRYSKGGLISYSSNLGKEHLNSILNLFETLSNEENVYLGLKKLEENITQGSKISADSLKHEVKKAELITDNPNLKEKIFELEDYKYLKGDIHNFITIPPEDINFNIEAIKKIYKENDSLIIRAMLTIDDYKLEVGLAGPLNGRKHKFFFGKKDNWETILTNKDKKYKKIFKDFLENYKKSDLDLMIENYKSEKKDWRYYFIKYPSMTSFISKEEGFESDYNLFAWLEEDGFYIEKINSKILRKQPINPYARTVFIELKNPEWLIKEYDGDDFRSYLKINGKIDKFYLDKDGWHIKFNDNYKNTEKEAIDSLTENFTLQHKSMDGIHTIKKNDKDLIQIAVAFLKEVNEL